MHGLLRGARGRRWFVFAVSACAALCGLLCCLVPSPAATRRARLLLIEKEVEKGNYYGWNQAWKWQNNGLLAAAESDRLHKVMLRYRRVHRSLSTIVSRWRLGGTGEPYVRVESLLISLGLGRWVDGGLPFYTPVRCCGPALNEMPLWSKSDTGLY
jgi:hypothetical protein